MQKIILDVDTGTDDAVAIIAALLSPELDVLGITTVNGNRCVEFTTENTLRVVEMLGNKVPVYKGCEMPLVSALLGRRPELPKRGLNEEHEIHGNFLDMLPKATIKEQDINAVSWIIETLMKAEDNEITLVPVGPLTNIAHAVMIEPRIIPKIKEIMYMGGGYKTMNETAASEFNVWVDPEAAQIVLDTKVKFTWVPLDATHDCNLTLEDVKRLRSLNTKVANVTADLIEQRIDGYRGHQQLDQEDAAPIHDALCIAALLDHSVLRDVVDANCQVDLGGGAAYGQTIFDIRNGRLFKRLAPNSKVALGADREKFANMIYNIVASYKEN